MRGIPVVPGVGYGPAYIIASDDPTDFDFADFKDAAAALAAYDQAVDGVGRGYTALADRASGDAAQILEVAAALTRDPALRSAVADHLVAGAPLPVAVEKSVAGFVDRLARAGGAVAARNQDLRDIERRLLESVMGVPWRSVPMPDEPSVLVAEDLAPADTAGLDAAKIVALVTQRGGPTSHTAIIARQLGIPCVVGVSGLHSVVAGTLVMVDGTTGEVDVAPDREEATARVARAHEARAALASWTGPAATSDGTRVKLLANVADGPSARAAADGPVEGVGLFRTELCFLNRNDEPSVEEQADIYAEVLNAFGPDRNVVIRTLDAGSDKPMAFATLGGEQNPALGVRGLRLSLGNPGLMLRQLEAIARAAALTSTSPWVMAPMVATVSEAADFAEQVRAHGLKAGVMVEIPSAALQAHKMLEVVDFLSIGTNDLTQYTMAADRMASDLAHLTDAWQPAVLSLVAITAEAGKQAGKPVGVCGEAAADPMLATALVGMGVTSLSMALAAVRPVGAQLGRVSMDRCEQAAEAALAQADPISARAAVRELLDPVRP